MASTAAMWVLVELPIQILPWSMAIQVNVVLTSQFECTTGNRQFPTRLLHQLPLIQPLHHSLLMLLSVQALPLHHVAANGTAPITINGRNLSLRSDQPRPGHISGVLPNNLQIANIDATIAGSYRCCA